MMKEDLISAILADETIEDDEQRRKLLEPLIGQAIQDAQAEIDGYLSKRYPLPLTPAPAVLNKFAKDISVYNLVSRIGIDESDRDKNYLNRYQAAVKFLTLVAEGKIEIGTTTTQTRAETGFCIRSNDRIFSRGSMKGW